MPRAGAMVSSTSSWQGLGRGIDARPCDAAGIGDVLWLRSRVESERQGERIERPLRSRAQRRPPSRSPISTACARRSRALRSDAEAWEIATDQERTYSDATAKVDELTRPSNGLRREASARAQGGTVRGTVGRRWGREGGRMPPGDPARLDRPSEACAIHLALTYRRPARGNGLAKFYDGNLAEE